MSKSKIKPEGFDAKNFDMESELLMASMQLASLGYFLSKIDDRNGVNYSYIDSYKGVPFPNPYVGLGDLILDISAKVAAAHHVIAHPPNEEDD